MPTEATRPMRRGRQCAEDRRGTGHKEPCVGGLCALRWPAFGAGVSGNQWVRAPVGRPVRRSSLGDLAKAGSVRVHGVDVLDLPLAVAVKMLKMIFLPSGDQRGWMQPLRPGRR